MAINRLFPGIRPPDRSSSSRTAVKARIVLLIRETGFGWMNLPDLRQGISKTKLWLRWKSLKNRKPPQRSRASMSPKPFRPRKWRTEKRPRKVRRGKSRLRMKKKQSIVVYQTLEPGPGYGTVLRHRQKTFAHSAEDTRVCRVPSATGCRTNNVRLSEPKEIIVAADACRRGSRNNTRD